MRRKCETVIRICNTVIRQQVSASGLTGRQPITELNGDHNHSLYGRKFKKITELGSEKFSTEVKCTNAEYQNTRKCVKNHKDGYRGPK